MLPQQDISADSKLLISSAVHRCARQFLSLADALTTESRFTAQVSSATVDDELDRFKLWAGNIAAHRKGRRSLEYRLRDATHLKYETHSLLENLSNVLQNATSIVRGEKTPWDEEAYSDSDSDCDLSDNDNTNPDIGNQTELEQLLTSARTVVTSLFRLTLAIRDPAPNDQSRSTITVDKSFFEKYDIDHVRAKFPQCPDWLSERLGHAMSGRRNYLGYREKHHEKLSKNVEKIGVEEPRTELTTNSTEATPFPQLDRANSLNVVDNDRDDSLSRTSYATSTNATIRIPALPKDAREKEFFECPLCFMVVSIRTSAGWKQHVYRDLHPYSCTSKACVTADKLYDSRSTWFAHEVGAHRTHWQCVEECGKVFYEQLEFDTHVRMEHPEFASLETIEALRRTSVKSADSSEQVRCALCSMSMTLRALQKHMGHHQEQLALFALPPNLDDAEDAPADEMSGSLGAGVVRDEESSDMNHTHESEEESAHRSQFQRELEDEVIHGINTNHREDVAEDEKTLLKCGCSACGKHFAQAEDLQSHMTKEHSVLLSGASLWFSGSDEKARETITTYLKLYFPDIHIKAVEGTGARKGQHRYLIPRILTLEEAEHLQASLKNTISQSATNRERRPVPQDALNSQGHDSLVADNNLSNEAINRRPTISSGEEMTTLKRDMEDKPSSNWVDEFSHAQSNYFATGARAGEDEGALQLSKHKLPIENDEELATRSDTWLDGPWGHNDEPYDIQNQHEQSNHGQRTAEGQSREETMDDRDAQIKLRVAELTGDVEDKIITEEQTMSPPWSLDDDKLLIRAGIVRAGAQRLDWEQISSKYFPSRTPTACRKRHEQLMESVYGRELQNDGQREGLGRMEFEGTGKQPQNIEEEAVLDTVRSPETVTESLGNMELAPKQDSLSTPEEEDSSSSKSQQEIDFFGTCTQCSKTFTGRYGRGNLRRHMTDYHSLEMNSVGHSCNIPSCDIAYKRSDALRVHTRRRHPELRLPPAVTRKESVQDSITEEDIYKVHASRYVEGEQQYQVADLSTGKLYRDGAWLHDRDLDLNKSNQIPLPSGSTTETGDGGGMEDMEKRTRYLFDVRHSITPGEK